MRMKIFHLFQRLVFLIVVLVTTGVARADIVASDLRVEGLDSPLGIDNGIPHFSWKVLGDSQKAYEIEVASSRQRLEEGAADVWASGTVRSDECVMIPYGGRPLVPRTLYYWRVRLYDSTHAGRWTATQRFGVGIIEPDAMRGQFIGMGWGQEKSVVLSRSFKVKTKGMDAALLHVNSLGYHEVYVNGQRVTDAVLTPAVTQMDKRSLIVTYDIAPLLRKGENTLVLWIASGWYKKDTFQARYNGAAVRADLDIVRGTTTEPLLCTDGSWMGTEGGYEDHDTWRARSFGSERIDARIVPTDLSAEGLKGRSWTRVETVAQDSIGLVATPQMCRLTVCKEVLTPVSVERLAGDRWLVDIGRIVNGMTDIHLPALAAGHEVSATYAEVLNADDSPVYVQGNDVFVASGNAQGDTFSNRFDHRPFRYIILNNLPTKPDRKDIQVRRIGYDAKPTGTFRCSDDDLNSIHHLLAYTMENLAFGGYMVDCIGRERLGYGGDGNASTLSLQNNFDVAPMYVNWLTAWNDAIQPDGSVPHTAPNPYPAGGGPYWCSFVVQAPWRTWWSFGDDRLLERCYATMKLWLRYVDAHTREGLLQKWPDTQHRIWYLGDWLAPRGTDVFNDESLTLINNCALSQSYAELEQIARHLKRQDDEQEFARRRRALNDAIHATFFHPEDSTYAAGYQIDLAYPLLVNAVPQEYVAAVTQKLTQGTTQLGVGLVGIPVLTEWATLNGQADFLYTLLKHDSYPGYLDMMRHGGTGTWEDWDNPLSFLHNCFNGADSWFYQALGGIIATSPGYRTARIAPQAPKGVSWVRVTRETPYGTILVNWKRSEADADSIDVHVEIPNGTEATLADGTVLAAGTHDCRLAVASEGTSY